MVITSPWWPRKLVMFVVRFCHVKDKHPVSNKKALSKLSNALQPFNCEKRCQWEQEYILHLKVRSHFLHNSSRTKTSGIWLASYNELKMQIYNFFSTSVFFAYANSPITFNDLICKSKNNLDEIAFAGSEPYCWLENKTFTFFENLLWVTVQCFSTSSLFGILKQAVNLALKRHMPQLVFVIKPLHTQEGVSIIMNLIQ